jgi:hypothetical protein
MKRILFVCFVVLTFAGCFEENTDMCLTLNLSIDDQYDPNDNFDSRVGNDLLVTAFQGGASVASFVVPYADIHNGECTVKKPDGLSGNVTFVAWGCHAASATGTSVYTPLQTGTTFDDFYFDLASLTRVSGSLSCPADFHFGADTVQVSSSEPTVCYLPLRPVACRVQVRLHAERDSKVPVSAVIYGTASNADLRGHGHGAERTVYAPFQLSSTDLYDTGVVSVFPSPDGQTVSVAIQEGTGTGTTLSAPISTRVAAQSGGYILFDYYVTTGTVTITVDGWRIAGVVTTNT